MERQFILQFLEIEVRILFIVDFLLVVAQSHEVAEMKGNISELCLVVLVHHLLHLLHVFVWKVLLN